MAVLAGFSATVKGVWLHDLGGTRVIRSFCRVNCVDVRLKHGHLLGHLEARVAAVVGSLMERVPIITDGCVSAF